MSTPDLLAIVQSLAALSDGLNNGNSAAEAQAARLAERAKQLLAALPKDSDVGALETSEADAIEPAGVPEHLL